MCVALFKLLLAMRQEETFPRMQMTVVCVPYYVAAVLRFMLHFLKEPITAPDGSSHRPTRPGTPIDPVHVMIFVIAFRIDKLNDLSWGATFWPLWVLFALLLVASVGTGFLAIGILLTREPRDRGQRALFFLCYGILLTITSTGLTFLICLSRRLDGDESISYTMILAPLITGYSLLLCFYLVFTLVLPRLMLQDATLAALGEDDSSDDDEEGGMIEAVSQQLAPPVLVQQSATLFKRMNNTAMFDRFMKSGEATGDLPTSKVSPGGDELAISDLEADGGAEDEITPKPMPKVSSCAVEMSCTSVCVDVGEDARSLGLDQGAAGIMTPGDELEYETLQSDIEQWVRERQRSTRRKGRHSNKVAAPAEGEGVPAEIKRKLQRLVALNQQLAAAAGAEGCGNSNVEVIPCPTRIRAAHPPQPAPALPAPEPAPLCPPPPPCRPARLHSSWLRLTAPVPPPCASGCRHDGYGSSAE